MGATLIVIGLVFALNPDLPDRIVRFFQDFTTVAYPFPDTSSTISFPAPMSPGTHTTVYNAVMQFDAGIAILQMVILGMRLYAGSPIRKIAETVGNLVFWLGAAFTTSVLLNGATTVSEWFMYWAAIIILVGVGMVVRAVVLLLRRP